MLDHKTIHVAFYEKAIWRLKFIWLPKRCELTNKLMCCSYVYEGIAIWFGSTELVVERRYHLPEQHLLWLIQR
jgi:hypothetical protein